MGETGDVIKRLFQHNNSTQNTFTSKYRPWKIAATFQAPSKTYALTCERFIKHQKSKTFIKKIIQMEQLLGNLALLVRVPKLRD